MEKKLFVVLILILFIPLSISALEIDSMIYSIDSNQNRAILVSCKNQGEILIPDSITYEGKLYPIKLIGDGYNSVFKKGVTKVIIPPTVRSVRPRALAYCSTLSDLIIEDSNEVLTIGGRDDSVGPGAFYRCENLRYMYIGRSLDSNLFYQTFISGPIKVEVSPNLKSISGLGYAPLEPYIDLKNVENINGYSFYKTPIEIVKTSNKLKYIYDCAFEDSQLKAIDLGDKIEWIGTGAFRNSKITKIVLPPSIETIRDEALKTNSLDTIIIEDSSEPLWMTDVNMFVDNPLKKIHLGRNINSISMNEFSGPFGFLPKNNVLYPPLELTIGENVTRINRSMFVNRIIRDLILPDSIEELMFYAFAYSSSNFCFYDDKLINYVKIPKNLKKCTSPFYHRRIQKEDIPAGISYLSGDLTSVGSPEIFKIPSSVEVLEDGTTFWADTIILENRAIPLDLKSVKFKANYIYAGMPLVSYSNYAGNIISCNKLEIGSDVTTMSAIELKAEDNDDILIVSNPIVPPSFYKIEKSIYDNAKVIIDFNAYDAYQKSKTWEGFLNYEFFINLSAREMELSINESFELNGHINDLYSHNNSILWESSNEEIATVSNGKVFAKSPGICIVTANDKLGHSASCTINVKPTIIESLEIDPSEWTGIEGETFHIQTTILPTNATEKTLEWTSSDESVATVDSNGLVTVLKGGNCIITAKTTDGSNLSAECVVTSTAGIDDVLMDINEIFDVYSIEGALIQKDCNRDYLKKLSSGLYILQQGNKSEKVIIR